MQPDHEGNAIPAGSVSSTCAASASLIVILPIPGTDPVAPDGCDPLEETVPGSPDMPFADIGKTEGTHRDRHDNAALNGLGCTDVEALLKGPGWIIEDEIPGPEQGQADPRQHAGQDEDFRARGERWRRHRRANTQVLRHPARRKPPRSLLRGGLAQGGEMAIPSGSRGSHGGLSCL